MGSESDVGAEEGMGVVKYLCQQQTKVLQSIA
jgi:hypothetical protein